MAELPQGDETPGVTTAGEGVPGEDGWGWGGDGNPPATRETEGQVSSGGANERMGGPRTAPPPRPQRGTTADNGSAGTPIRHTAGTDSTRPEHGALAGREYVLLVLIGMAVNLAAAGGIGSEDGHGEGNGTTDQAWREGGRETKPDSACSQRAACEEPMTMEGDPLNGCTRLIHAAAERGNAGDSRL